MNRFVLLLFTVCAFNFYYGQERGIINATAESALVKFKAGNYEEALEDYLQLLVDDSRNEVYNYNVGVCYLNSNTNKGKAVSYLQIVTRKDKYDPNADYLLGRAYQYNNKFDDAIAAFKKFKQDAKGTVFNLVDADLQIQHCINAKELMKFPVNVIFQNLGNNINSQYNDYYPFTPANESFIVYNTKRPEKNSEKLENGSFNNSIYFSKVENGQYSKAYPIGEPINKGNSGVEVIGLSENGENLLLHYPSGVGKGDIYVSKVNANGTFSKPEKLDSKVNSDAEEIAASISDDGNIIYFASNRKGGFGGTDIYVTKKIGKKWSEPKNIGSEINTPFDEDFPNLSPDGKTLYFSSKGHASMGGYDIFKATLDDDGQVYSSPKNIGYPINTTDDDMNFRVSKNGKYGYIASAKAGGFGDFDIYRVSFNDVESEYSVIIGEFTTSDQSEVNYSDVFISVNDNVSKELIGNYLPNPANGRFVIILPPGKYQMNIDAPGYKLISKDIEIHDKVSYQAEIDMKVNLEK
jgi:tetratricopeptide (TPR) repeat protein